VGIFRNYPFKTRNSKQSIRKISGYEIIPFYLLKYPRSKQNLSGAEVTPSLPLRMVAVVIQGQLLKKLLENLTFLSTVVR
jgi:hypothetical protein